MIDDLKATTPSTRIQWRRWGIRIIKAGVLAIAGAIALEIYTGFRTVAARVAAGSSPTAAVAGPMALEVSPVSRETAFHGVLFVGHTDYLVTYQVKLANFSASENRRITMQFDTTSGYLAYVTFPPIVRAKRVGGTELNKWSDTTHSKKLKSVAFELDQPGVGSEISIGVVVLSTRGFPPDSDLGAKLMTPSGLISATGKTVTWWPTK